MRYRAPVPNVFASMKFITLSIVVAVIQVLQGLAGVCNPAYSSWLLFCALPCVAPYCVPGGIRVVSMGPVLSGVSGSTGPGLYRIKDTNLRQRSFQAPG